MTRTTLTVFALLAAGAASVLFATLLDAPAWWGLPAVPVTWYGLTWAGRAAHRAWVKWRLAREGGRFDAPFHRALATWACIPRLSMGEAWFTLVFAPTADLERVVLFPDTADATDERAVVADLETSNATSRRALVDGLRRLQDLAVKAVDSPLHPLFPEAESVLALVGHRPPRFLAAVRARKAWRARRAGVDPDAPEEAIAVRLLYAGLPNAALAALELAPTTPRRTRIRRLARFLALMRRGEAVRPEECAEWAEELLLLAGRSIADLVPGSPFVAAVPGGAGEMERALRRAPETIADLAALGREAPELAPLVLQVLSRVLAHRGKDDAKDAAPDRALSMHLRGVALVDEGRPREALGEFESALAHAPDFPAAAYALASTRRRLGEADAAREELRVFAIRHAGDADANLLFARYLAEEGREEEAKGVFEATIRRFPRSLALRMNYAAALASWGRETEAVAQVEAAHGDHPLEPRLALWAGRARVHGGRAKDAVKPLRLAAKRLVGPERAEAMFWLLAAWREQGRHDKALPYASRLVERLGAGQTAMLDEVAEYLEERHEFVKARAAAERARRLRGDEW